MGECDILAAILGFLRGFRCKNSSAVWHYCGKFAVPRQKHPAATEATAAKSTQSLISQLYKSFTERNKKLFKAHEILFI